MSLKVKGLNMELDLQSLFGLLCIAGCMDSTILPREVPKTILIIVSSVFVTYTHIIIIMGGSTHLGAAYRIYVGYHVNFKINILVLSGRTLCFEAHPGTAVHPPAHCPP
jgi:hypothetical protein